VAIQPGGLGAVFAPGQILDPINDLVEQFSEVMLFSAAVLGTQKLLIEMSGWVWFSVLLASVLLFWLVTLWQPRYFSHRTQRLALALLRILVIVRFLVPVAAIANEAVFDLFLAPSYEVANRQLEDATRELGSDEKRI
jgi:predicted permease